MPDFFIIDTHVHLWDPKRLRYAWLSDAAELNRPFLPPDFHKACGDVRVEKIVFVQADCQPAQAVDELAWVASLAEANPIIAGAVAFAPLEKGDAAREDLDRLARDPRHALLRGIRRLIQSEPDPRFCLRPEFVRGVQLLSTYDLSFDLCILHSQLENTTELVRKCPQVRFILDHIGKPDIRGHVLDPWRQHLRDMSKLPNVVCKISGLVTEADHSNWTREALRPYIDHVIECFGFDRVMFGSDWPVERLASDYPRWVETLEWAVDGATTAEKRKLFRDNAIAEYRL